MGMQKINDFAAVFVAAVILLSTWPANGSIYSTPDAVIFKVDRAADGSFTPKVFPIEQSDFTPISYFLKGGLINPEFLPKLNSTRKDINLYYNIGPYHPLLQEQNLYNGINLLHPFVFPPTLNSRNQREIKQNENIPCGVGPNSNRIVNGQEAVPNSWPFVVGFKALGNNIVFCGGSLISKTKILTAAHCFERLSLLQVSQRVVKLGMHERGNNFGGKEDAQITRRISSVAIHKSYDTASYDYDVAVVTMDEPVTYSSAVSSVCLPPVTDQMDQYAGKSASVMGWGTTAFGTDSYPSKLMQATIPVITNAECADIYILPNTITSNMLCASANQSDSCQGDSGGPLVVQSDDGSWAQVGIVSFGYGCADPDFPAGVYSNVPGLVSWIDKYMRQ